MIFVPEPNNAFKRKVAISNICFKEKKMNQFIQQNGCIFRLKMSLNKCNQWPNLKNLSGGLNLSRGLNMVGST